MWWIKRKDLTVYENLMGQFGDKPQIIQEDGDYVMVLFSAAALQTWAQAGYWFGDRPTKLSGFFHKCLTLFRKVL